MFRSITRFAATNIDGLFYPSKLSDSFTGTKGQILEENYSPKTAFYARLLPITPLQRIGYELRERRYNPIKK